VKTKNQKKKERPNTKRGRFEGKNVWRNELLDLGREKSEVGIIPKGREVHSETRGREGGKVKD